jgi:hypothetical protein
VAKWYINEIVAERYSDGNIFCLGDAVHRVSTEQQFEENLATKKTDTHIHSTRPSTASAATPASKTPST